MRAFLIYLALSGCATVFIPARNSAQEPAPTPPSASTESSSKQQSANSASKHSGDFLIRGTVFTEQGFALPGAEMHIRRSTEKKYRWQTASNSRGDFAVRVKMGADYEITVQAKGYQEQSLSVTATTGERFKDVVFRLQPVGGKKS